jgi:hypothetical protein
LIRPQIFCSVVLNGIQIDKARHGRPHGHTQIFKEIKKPGNTIFHWN